MNEIISFQNWKQTSLRDALAAAEGTVDRLSEEIERLRRIEAPYSEQLRASMNLDRARQARRKCERAFARFCGADFDEPEETTGFGLGEVIALTR